MLPGATRKASFGVSHDAKASTESWHPAWFVVLNSAAANKGGGTGKHFTA